MQALRVGCWGCESPGASETREIPIQAKTSNKCFLLFLPGRTLGGSDGNCWWERRCLPAAEETMTSECGWVGPVRCLRITEALVFIINSSNKHLLSANSVQGPRQDAAMNRHDVCIRFIGGGKTVLLEKTQRST